jgi:hypothetical protein
MSEGEKRDKKKESHEPLKIRALFGSQTFPKTRVFLGAVLRNTRLARLDLVSVRTLILHAFLSSLR